MSELFTLTATDLAALLCSRVCHDVISPVGAINNGLELLDEGGADEDAMHLIRTSARNASARLQFARIAFGAALVETPATPKRSPRRFSRTRNPNSNGPASARFCPRTPSS
jgi:hypothetical protein